VYYIQLKVSWNSVRYGSYFTFVKILNFYHRKLKRSIKSLWLKIVLGCSDNHRLILYRQKLHFYASQIQFGLFKCYKMACTLFLKHTGLDFYDYSIFLLIVIYRNNYRMIHGTIATEFACRYNYNITYSLIIIWRIKYFTYILFKYLYICLNTYIRVHNKIYFQVLHK
jgi:hypothetical protein